MSALTTGGGILFVVERGEALGPGRPAFQPHFDAYQPYDSE